MYDKLYGVSSQLDALAERLSMLPKTVSATPIFKQMVKLASVKKVICPQCGFENHFWGYADDEGKVYEHFGRKCRGMIVDTNSDLAKPCGFRFRMKICHHCQAENDITAKECEECHAVLIDADTKLKQAKLSKNAHIIQPEKITFTEKKDKNHNPYLEIRYFDFDGKYLSEAYFFNNPTAIKKFNINFLRSHFRQPEMAVELTEIQQIIKFQKLFRTPAYVIARKQEQFWKITEKIFSEELNSH